MTQTNLSMKQKQTQRHRKEACGCQRGRRMREGTDWEFGVSRCKLLQIEWTDNKVLLHGTRNYIQCPGINHNGKEYKKECVHMYNRVALLYNRNQHNIVNQLYFNFKKQKNIKAVLGGKIKCNFKERFNKCFEILNTEQIACGEKNHKNIYSSSKPLLSSLLPKALF